MIGSMFLSIARAEVYPLCYVTEESLASAQQLTKTVGRKVPVTKKA